MNEIIEILEDIEYMDLPANQLGMPNYLSYKIGMLRTAVDRINKIIEHLERRLREWEDI
jgi:hypothetical protein